MDIYIVLIIALLFFVISIGLQVIAFIKKEIKIGFYRKWGLILLGSGWVYWLCSRILEGIIK